MQISVVLAARNAELYLRDFLASLARQAQPPHELVACDDGSEDSTPELLAAFASEARFPVHIERFPERRGHVEAFMHAARLARGDAIAFADHDDVWLEKKLQICGSELAHSGATLVMHAARLVDAELRELGREWPAVGKTRTVPPLGLTGLDIDAPGMAMVFRREILDVADFDDRPPSRYGLGRQMLHDEWILFLAGVLGPVRLVAEPLLLYRQHGSNDSGGWVDRSRRSTLEPAIGHYRQAAAHTAACAEYLQRTARDSEMLAERLGTGAREYARMSANWSNRVSLYHAPDRRARARALRRLIVGQAYRSRTVGGFGRAALGKDLAAGVALGMRPTDLRQ